MTEPNTPHNPDDPTGYYAPALEEMTRLWNNERHRAELAEARADANDERDTARFGEVERLAAHLETMREFRDYAQSVASALVPAWVTPEVETHVEPGTMWTVPCEEPRTFTDPQGDVWTYRTDANGSGWRITTCPHVTEKHPAGQHLETASLRPVVQDMGAPFVRCDDALQGRAVRVALNELDAAREKGWTREHDAGLPVGPAAGDGDLWEDHLAHLIHRRLDGRAPDWPAIAGLALAALERDL